MPDTEFEKTYAPGEIEARIYAMWEAANAFAAGAGARHDDSYCIVIPPPNVTGSLHMGHALDETLQDILIRFERLRGKDVLWQPGMDHAGIATQMVVERQLAAQKQPDRHALGRDKFVEKIWQWKAQSGGRIIDQLKRLGASCDWSRERFTMDAGLSRAVIKVFVQLFDAGLIYRDKRLVNWDPKLLTAISDLEVEPIEVHGHLWHFKYPIADEADRYISVATTRPETMLGDTAVAVHPQDERYGDLIGRHVALPLAGRRIPIIADEHADPQTGSGAVKITPAHDFNDFNVGKRHDLAMINVLDPRARMDLADNAAFLEGLVFNDDLDEVLALDGLGRTAARERIVAMMDARGLLEKTQDHVYMVPHGDRSGVVIEPYLTDQWYVNASALAGPAIEAVRQGRTRFVPKTWENTYFQWMENIQPWCISRQLWWGHRIPVWYGPQRDKDKAEKDTPAIFCAETWEEVAARARNYYGVQTVLEAAPGAAPEDGEDADIVRLRRDEDVLDTWFSSALWPFSTLGWPDETPELKRYYKTDVLVTGFDIIFFWVARMMMLGLHVMDEEPFHTVYIHGLVRDEKGRKMSKTAGNVVDPLVFIDKYGADAVRFTLAAMETQGRDMPLSEPRVAGYRNFATKLWNAARFCHMNDCRHMAGFDPALVEETINKWIIAETAAATTAVTDALERYRFCDAAAAAYRFVWNIYCDWYLEFAKPLLQTRDKATRRETGATAAWVLDQVLCLLHPFMPFITEEIWRLTASPARPQAGPLMLGRWPGITDLTNEDAQAQMRWLIELIGAIRSVRAELNVPAGALVPLFAVDAGARTKDDLITHDAAIKRLARIERIEVAAQLPAATVQLVVNKETFALSLSAVIDVQAESRRLAGRVAEIDTQIASLSKKLENEAFLAKAPQAVIDGQRERLEAACEKRQKLSAALARLG